MKEELLQSLIKWFADESNPFSAQELCNLANQAAYMLGREESRPRHARLYFRTLSKTFAEIESMLSNRGV